MSEIQVDVAIIGAGPAGSVAAALLQRLGHRVLMIENQQFPRFSIGESLLPQCMVFLEQADLLQCVNAAGFQLKNGANFSRDGNKSGFDFTEKFSAGHGTTFQVQRARFDHLLADQVAQRGVEILYGHRVVGIVTDLEGHSKLDVVSGENVLKVAARFVLDASGFGRVLPRLLALESPSEFPVRRSVFTHVEDRIGDTAFDRNRILIVVNPRRQDVWYWLIPFSNGRASLGVVAEQDYFEDLNCESPAELLKAAVEDTNDLSRLVRGAIFDTEVRSIVGYSASVSSLYGNGFALLGNAGEFLDPVFSSGVTIAMKSATLAAPLVDKQLRGEAVDWEIEYSEALKRGVNTFKAYVKSWYSGAFQDIIFAPNQNDTIRRMISSILAGYAWDAENPFVAEPERRLRALAALCAG